MTTSTLWLTGERPDAAHDGGPEGRRRHWRQPAREPPRDVGARCAAWQHRLLLIYASSARSMCLPTGLCARASQPLRHAFEKCTYASPLHLCMRKCLCAGARSRKRPLMPASESPEEGPEEGDPMEGRKSEAEHAPAQSGSPTRQRRRSLQRAPLCSPKNPANSLTRVALHMLAWHGGATCSAF